MSQHDFDFTTADGNTGITVRAGMNAMAQALASCSSGAAEPSTMCAYQFWADTTSGYMKQRNAANNAWLTRWQLSVGQLAALAGATFTGLVNLAAGADIASAATVDLTAATGNFPRITGTTPTSAVTMNSGQLMLVVADGAWPLTYHATTNKISTGGIDYTCTAGDVILYYKDLSGVVHGVIFSDERLASGRIKFPATKNASTDANTLDDYEEGTWSPTLTNFGGTGITASGSYIKIGRLVSWIVVISGTNVVSTANSSYFDLPFTASSSALAGHCVAANSSTESFGVGIGAGSGATTQTPGWSANNRIIVSGSYIATS